MGFRRSFLKDKLLKVLEDGRPRFRFEIVEELRHSGSAISDCLTRLWHEGQVLRSRDRVGLSHVDVRPRVGKFWRKISGFMWISSNSFRVLPSGLVKVELKKTERYTLKTTLVKQNVMFVEYREEEIKRKISQKSVRELLEKRTIGVVSREVADHFGVISAKASNILEKLRKKGEVERRGHYNPKLMRETPFRGKIQGYVYGLAGTEQAQKRVEQGDGLYSRYVKAVFIEIHKDSSQKRFTAFTKFVDDIGDYETLKAIRILTQIYSDLQVVHVGGLGFIYDKTFFSEEEVKHQLKIAEKRVSRKKLLTGAIGAFHEGFAQKTADIVLNKIKTKTSFWKRVKNGKALYDIRLSNGRQIDRVMQIDLFFKKQLLWSHYFPIECKYHKGGAKAEHVLEFINKLRTSREFGEVVELQEGKQTFKVHVIKQNAFPILIAPHFKKEAYHTAKHHHVELLPTWLLAKYAGETISKKLDIKKLFAAYIKEGGGNIQTFLNQAFRKN